MGPRERKGIRSKVLAHTKTIADTEALSPGDFQHFYQVLARRFEQMYKKLQKSLLGACLALFRGFMECVELLSPIPNQYLLRSHKLGLCPGRQASAPLSPGHEFT
eukprot:1161685-Pelagomonas_calceolata.AAC.5